MIAGLSDQGLFFCAASGNIVNEIIRQFLEQYSQNE